MKEQQEHLLFRLALRPLLVLYLLRLRVQQKQELLQALQAIPLHRAVRLAAQGHLPVEARRIQLGPQERGALTASISTALGFLALLVMSDGCFIKSAGSVRRAIMRAFLFGASEEAWKKNWQSVKSASTGDGCEEILAKRVARNHSLNGPSSSAGLCSGPGRNRAANCGTIQAAHRELAQVIVLQENAQCQEARRVHIFDCDGEVTSHWCTARTAVLLAYSYPHLCRCRRCSECRARSPGERAAFRAPTRRRY